jgi:hypothetical protein
MQWAAENLNNNRLKLNQNSKFKTENLNKNLVQN